MKTRLLAVLLFLAGAAGAIDPKSLKPQGYVNDYSNVLDAAAREDLARYCGAVEKATGAQIALVTIPTLEGESVEYFANELYRTWGIGQKGKDEGVLLLLVTADRHSRLEVGRGLEPVITDGTAGSLLRQMRPALQSGDYAAAFGTAAHEIGQRIAAAKGVTIDENLRPRRRVHDEPNSIPFPLIVGAFVILLVIMSSRRRGGGGGGGLGSFLPGLILGNMMGRSPYRGYGGGGFGGYDSGGGFGGFGGGDSGGGGASSNW